MIALMILVGSVTYRPSLQGCATCYKRREKRDYLWQRVYTDVETGAYITTYCTVCGSYRK